MAAKSKRLHITFDKKPVLSLYFAPTKHGGITIGFADPSYREVHLTVYTSPKDGRLHSHLTDPSAKGHPWSQQITFDLVNEWMAKWVKRWTVPISAIPRVFTMTDALARKTADLRPQASQYGGLSLPLELHFARLRLDLKNRRRWRSMPTREFAANPRLQGAIIRRGRPCWVHPISGDPEHVVVFTEAQFKRYQDRVARLFGFRVLLDYLELKKLGPTYVEFRKRAGLEREKRGSRSHQLRRPR